MQSYLVKNSKGQIQSIKTQFGNKLERARAIEEVAVGDWLLFNDEAPAEFSRKHLYRVEQLLPNGDPITKNRFGLYTIAPCDMYSHFVEMEAPSELSSPYSLPNERRFVDGEIVVVTTSSLANMGFGAGTILRVQYSLTDIIHSFSLIRYDGVLVYLSEGDLRKASDEEVHEYTSNSKLYRIGRGDLKLRENDIVEVVKGDRTGLLSRVERVGIASDIVCLKGSGWINRADVSLVAPAEATEL